MKKTTRMLTTENYKEVDGLYYRQYFSAHSSQLIGIYLKYEWKPITKEGFYNGVQSKKANWIYKEKKYN